MDQLLNIIKDLMNEEFDSLLDSRQRVDYAFDKIQSIDDLRQNVSQFLAKHRNKNMKSVHKSDIYRRIGNRFFDIRNLEYALYYYSSAVMSAPYPADSGLNSDNELCFAYTSRSLTFFEMQLYSNALFDIECALQLSVYSMNFSDRLELMTHKLQCLCQLGRYDDSLKLVSAMIQLIPCLPNNNDLVRDLIKMKDSISERNTEDSTEDETENVFDQMSGHCYKIDNYVSDDLHLSEAEQKGRFYAAKDAIPNRKIVLIERLISGVLFQPFFKTHCQYCFKNIGYKYWPCSQCNQVVFCDQNCAQSAYYHYFECGITEILDGLGANHYIICRLILSVGPQMAIDLAKQTSKQLEVLDESDGSQVNYLKFLQLSDHRDSYDLKTKAMSVYRSIQLTLLLDAFKGFETKTENNSEFLKDLTTIADIFNYKAIVNAFGMFEQKSKCRAFRGDHIGNAVCFMASFFNHSCSPNLFWQFNGQHITVVTTKDVDSGEELGICYGPYSESMAFNKRQEFLKKRYFFQCSCSACVNDAKQLPTLKCHYCSDGFFIYETDWTESSCLVCGKRLQISTIIKSVEEIEESFSHWMNEFEKRSKSETLLMRAEKCYSDFSKFLYNKSQRMIEINVRLSRSFDSIGNYSKAMNYSQNILLAFESNESFRYCIELVFYSRVYYYYLHKQRKSMSIDNEWRKCFQIISGTIIVLKNCKKALDLQMKDKSLPETDLKVISKGIQFIDCCLKCKEKQICFISKLTDS